MIGLDSVIQGIGCFEKDLSCRFYRLRLTIDFYTDYAFY